MSRNPFLCRVLRITVFLSVGFLGLFAQVGQAADALNYFKNYFVTGDYVVGGVGLRGTGVNGFATGIINIGGPGTNGSAAVPVTNGVPADIVAAFLYWQTDESASTPSAMNGFFDFDRNGKPNPIVGTAVGDAQNLACDQSSAHYGRVYRADVRRFLKIVNGARIANGPHTVSLPDRGSGSVGPLTNGGSLVVVYRVLLRGQPRIAPLRSVVLYDGAFTIDKNTGKLDQTIAGFYQADQPTGVLPTKLTAIAGNGEPSYVDNLNVTTSYGPGSFTKPFTGSAGGLYGHWDNPTFNILLKQNDSNYSFHVTFAAGVCLTFTTFVTSTQVVDTDRDGLLDIWETNGLHLNNQTSPATFGGCSDYPTDPANCVNLPAMGANPTIQDIFLEIDWMLGDVAGGTPHEHKPKLDALSALAMTFANHGIRLHFDVGNNYQGLGLPYIVPAWYARGGDVIPESTLLCPNAKTSVCAFYAPPNNYSVVGWKKGFRGIKSGFPALGIPPHFDHDRKDAFHWVLFGHASGFPFNPPTGLPKSTSGVADRPGGDVLITLGLWRSDDPAADQTGSALVQAGTLMHELGHNLNLKHGGIYGAPNCMPNYPSVMNYLYQTRGLTNDQIGLFGKEHIDYSNGLLLPLNENALSEAPGALGTLTYRVRFYGPTGLPGLPVGETPAKHLCNGPLALPGQNAIRLESAGLSTPDWNRDGLVDSPPPFDVNFNGFTGDPVKDSVDTKPITDPTKQWFVDSNDWSNLNLQQISARRNADGLSDDVGAADDSTGAADDSTGAADDITGAADDSTGAADDSTGAADDTTGAADDTTGELDYDTVISTLDPTSSDQPLTATNKIDRVTLSWGAPSIGQIRHYNIYRSDPAHPNFILLNHVDGAPPATTYDDVVNDFTDAGAACPNTSTCYNTTYTYYITSVDIDGTTSSASNMVTSEVTHLFVVADNQTTVYGNPNPSPSFQVFGDSNGTLSGATCAYPSPAPRNATAAPAGTPLAGASPYAISCSGPTTTDVNTGVTYVPDSKTAHYNNGTDHTPGKLTITQRPITVTATTNTKVYDGTTSAAAVPAITSAFTPSLAYTDTPNFIETYDNKNVGTGKTLTPSGSVNDGNGGNNYMVKFVSISTGEIDPRPITVTATANTKTYDGTTSSAAVPAITSAFTPSLAYTDTPNFIETYDNKNVGTGKTLTPSGSVNDGNGGNNYTVKFVSISTGEIDARPLTVTATGINKVYDGTTTATVTLSDNRVAGDGFTDIYSSANFLDPNVGTAKTVNVTGISISGTDAGNYTFNTTATTTANITPKPVTASITAANKVYDGTTAATITCTPVGVVSGDTVTCSAGSAAFSDPNAATGKTVNATGITLAGAQAGNYSLTSSTAMTTADITPASQTILFAPLPGKTFGDADFSVSATASSGLAVSFTASGNCTVTGSTVHLTSSGSCTITAHQAGNGNYFAAPDVPQTFSIAVAALNVLWYTGGVGTSSGGPSGYQAQINNLAASASANFPDRSWNVTFWSSGAMPAAPSGGWNVLVIASSIGPWSPSPDYSALNTAIAGGSLSFNPAVNRVLLSGQDADWHYMTFPGSSSFDGPKGFLLDSINWAGSGSGMGVVSMSAAPSFSFTGFDVLFTSTNNVVIPSPENTYPVNTGLSSTGLSNWFDSIHIEARFDTIDTSKWHGITKDGGTGNFATIVSAPFASSGLAP